jgi:K+-sensing histidine kinase KdpD
LTLTGGSEQCPMKATTESKAETMSAAASRESWHGRTFDPLSMSIIHDLRNPLAAICISAEVLTDPLLTFAHIQRLGRNIHKAADQIRELLADLLCGTQRRIAVAETCNLNEILAAVCE